MKNNLDCIFRCQVSYESQISAEMGMRKKREQYIMILNTFRAMSTVKRNRARIEKDRRIEHDM
jgi:hypothetical protein